MRREQSLTVLFSRTELKTGLAQTLWSEVCFLNTTNSPSKAECGFGWFVSPKSILKRGRLACCWLWKQRTDSPISIKYCLSFTSGLNHVSLPSDNGSGRRTFSSKHVALIQELCISSTQQIWGREKAKGHHLLPQDNTSHHSASWVKANQRKMKDNLELQIYFYKLNSRYIPCSKHSALHPSTWNKPPVSLSNAIALD